MKFNLQIDLGNEPSAKNLAGQLHKEAVTFWTATEPLKPQVWGIDDPRTMATVGKWEIFDSEIPQFKHDCSRCKFLGRDSWNGNDYDLYFCEQMIGGKTVIARYGNEGSEYTSGWGSTNPALQAAMWRAKRARFVADDQAPKAGKTLADFAGSGKAFKRPHHALAFGFIETTGFLKEFSYPDGDIGPVLARLTAEDLTATDWEEVPE